MAWPCAMRSTASGSRESNSRLAMNSSSAGTCGLGGRAEVVRVKWAAGAEARMTKFSGVPSLPVG